ncbi:hypothetical protein [Dyella flagellata]|uniref:Uncharacterized protein n=1 Tax=Dyella flagellata TaxID=1867833 RepID=A0ABQ5XD82_9GAMM|nr:hypothetical protein [Dyella flagellata]GLQ89650.1 hypothetical protein GCM10007898_32250 [Dyella flagellata]
MRSHLAALCLACFPCVVLADSVRTIEVINDTHSRIDTFAMAPAGSDRWIEVDFRAPMHESWFDHQLALMLQFHDNDSCLRDLRTELSDGRRIFARRFDLCRFHAYRPGMSFHHGHPGAPLMP